MQSLIMVKYSRKPDKNILYDLICLLLLLLLLDIGAIQNASQLLDQQHDMENKIFRIWQVLSAFEGKSKNKQKVL